MATANETVTATAGLLTILLGAYTAWTGYKSKGKDQEHARAAESYDNLQEDLRNCRLDVGSERERADKYQALWDASETRRMEELARFRDAMAADQLKRHELRSVTRSALARIMDANDLLEHIGIAPIDCSDLLDRVKRLDIPNPT